MNKFIGLTRGKAKSDAADPDLFQLVMITSPGNIVLELEGGKSHTITQPPTNMWLPVASGIRIKESSTASGFFVA
ncbi:MAG: hypothetical protein COB23_03220 [Methylophaga sp.]|nr:MAG: hypothetical protein COB23_03220 [Methylophaga sp.]